MPEEHFANAVAWNASTFQVATIAGPAIGGIAYAFFRGPEAVYAMAAAVAVLAIVSTARIEPIEAARPKEPVSGRTVLAGFRFIWERK